MSDVGEHDNGAVPGIDGLADRRTLQADQALRAAFAELRLGEESSPPPLARLLAPTPQRHGRTERIGGPGAAWAFLRSAAGGWAAAAVFLAAGLGLWLGDGGRGRRPVVAREEPALSSWVAPAHEEPALSSWVAATDFLLDTPGIELLRSTPEIPGPLPSTRTAATTDLTIGDLP